MAYQLRCLGLFLLFASLVSGVWNPFADLSKDISAHVDRNVGETDGTLTSSTGGLVIPPVRGGGFLWWKSTEEKGELAKEDAQKSWFWGKEYAKDKASDTKDAVTTKAEAAKKKSAKASEQGKESLHNMKDKLSDKYDTVKAQAKCVASKTTEGMKEGVDSTKSTLATGRHKIKAVGNTVEVLGDMKTGYDKYLHGKAQANQLVHSAEEGVEEGMEKTKGLLSWIIEVLGWPFRSRRVVTTTTIRDRGVMSREEGGPFVLEEENLVTAPKSVDDALEEFETCKVHREGGKEGGKKGGREISFDSKIPLLINKINKINE